MIKVIKRDGRTVDFDKSKIVTAILKAMKDADEINNDVANRIANDISTMNFDSISVERIQDIVEDMLMSSMLKKTARCYIRYRYKRNLARELKERDNTILELIQGSNEELNKENSNKNTQLASTQRDYMAGEVSKDLAKRILLPKKVVEAHENGILHFHDMDYSPIMPIFNCCLIDIKDMLDNGTCINGTMVESPKSFPVACTVMTQIIASVASGQYGGQTVNIKHLGKYLKRSYDKYLEMFEGYDCIEEWDEDIQEYHDWEDKYGLAKSMMLKDLKDGVQTIQYQINTISCTNGQTPFVTLFLELDPKDEYLEYTALIIEEILKQRIQGVKNEVGIYVTPTFPKLIYVLDEHNNLSGGKYDYLTKLACECTPKRMYPDYVSAKKMREHYQGNVFSPMGCRSFLSPWEDENGNYKFEGRFNQGVVTLNLPQIALVALNCKIGYRDEWLKYNDGALIAKILFKEELDKRLDLCFEALMCRHKSLLGVKSDVSPIHWQHGAIARLGKGEVIDPLLKGGYSTISLGYIGLYEVTKLMTGESQTGEKGHEFATWIMNYLREACDKWKEETGIGFALYGTPAETLCYRFAEIDKKRYGSIKDITDKDYYTNSYHIDVREPIDAFNKLGFESEFQKVSSGGCISYVEIPNLSKNVEAIEEVVKFIYENVQYGEFNTKLDCCQECGFEGEILLDDNNEWYCPNCGNRDTNKMNITRRTCGYIGSNLWNEGKTNEISLRVLHLGAE